MLSENANNCNKICLKGFLYAKPDEFWQTKQYAFNVTAKTGDTVLLNIPDQPIDKEVNKFSEAFDLSSVCLDKNQASDVSGFQVDVDLKIKRISSYPTKVDHELSACLAKMLDDPIYSDFTFNVKGKEIKVHRSILADRPVFKRCFEFQIQNIGNIEPNIFIHLMRFIYAGNLPENLNEVAMDLYVAARYFEVKDLKEICKQEIRANLSIENAFNIFNWCRLVGVRDLKIEAWKIIKR